MSVLGSLYWAGLLSYFFLKFSQAAGGIPPSFYTFLPFLVVFILAAVGVWKKPKAGYITAAAISGVSLLLVAPNLNMAQELSPEGLLAGGATANAILFVTLVFSLFGARGAWRKPAPGVRSFTLGRTAGIGALVFIIVFIAAGTAYGMTLSTTVPSSQAGIEIAPGAAYITSHDFYLPPTFQAKVGEPVVWKNLDPAPHTVTSDTGLFLSANMDKDATFSFTFTQPGTYHYVCDYHPWMTGTIVVASA